MPFPPAAGRASAEDRASVQDRCPGAVRLHPAADGGLARVRIPGGVLTGAQWQVLVAAAEELGNGRLELTSRGNLQLRGLSEGAEVALAARLFDAGLLPAPSHERVRNLLASPLSGRDGAGLLDVRPLIGDFDRAMCGRPALAELPGRFLFALDDGRADVLAGRPDIAATTTAPDRLQLLLAGSPVGQPVPGHAVVELMLAAAEAFLAERQAQDSTAWRVAELADGPARIAARLRLADPVGSAVSAGIAATADPAVTAGRPGSALVPGPVPQRDGTTALVVGIPLGSMTADQAAALPYPQLILTPWRSIVVPDLTADRLADLLDTCARLGLLTDSSGPLHRVTACTGRPGCASALADVRADALTMHGGNPATAPAPVHWSGCARRCGRPAGTVIDVIATGSGYQVHRGTDSTTVGGTPAELSTALSAELSTALGGDLDTALSADPSADPRTAPPLAAAR